MTTGKNLKIVAATLTVLGIILSFLNLLYTPHVLVLESSPTQPPWFPWVSWIILSLGPIVYIIVDILELRRKK